MLIFLVWFPISLGTRLDRFMRKTRNNEKWKTIMKIARMKVKGETKTLTKYQAVYLASFPGLGAGPGNEATAYPFGFCAIKWLPTA